MAIPSKIRLASICAGVGGLDLSLRLVYGERLRPVVFLEREAYAASVLVARMADASMGEALVWNDLTTFDGRPWRGAVDLVCAGFPCQPFSAAGKQKHTEDDRWLWPDIARILREMGTGEPDGPELVFLENVTGLTLSPDVAGKSGWCLPAGLWHVLGDLAAMGFDAEWGCVRASDVGAPHRRYRLFILAHAARGNRQAGQRLRISLEAGEGSESRIAGCVDTVGDTGKVAGVPGSGQPRRRRAKEPANQSDGGSRESGAAMADTGRRQLQEPERQQEGRERSGSAGTVLANAALKRTRSVSDHAGRASDDVAHADCGGQPVHGDAQSHRRGSGHPELADDELDVADSSGRGRDGRTAAFQGGDRSEYGLSIPPSDSVADADCRRQPDDRSAQSNYVSSGVGHVELTDDELVVASGEGLQGHCGNGDDRDESRWLGAEPSGPVRERSLGLFPPGPGLGGYGVIDSIIELYERDPNAAWERYQAELANTLRWRDVLDTRPDLAPSIEVNTPAQSKLLGVANGMANRVDRLRAVGEGVCSLAASVAFYVLAHRLGIEIGVDE